MAVPLSMPGQTLGSALLAGVAHYDLAWPEEAAIRLLVADGVWLAHRNDFRDRCTVIDRGAKLTAWADWPTVASHADLSPAPDNERSILRLACHLAGAIPTDIGKEWTLQRILNRLDVPTSVIASRAFAFAALGPDAVGPLT